MWVPSSGTFSPEIVSVSFSPPNPSADGLLSKVSNYIYSSLTSSPSALMATTVVSLLLTEVSTTPFFSFLFYNPTGLPLLFFKSPSGCLISVFERVVYRIPVASLGGIAETNDDSGEYYALRSQRLVIHGVTGLWLVRFLTGSLHFQYTIDRLLSQYMMNHKVR